MRIFLRKKPDREAVAKCLRELEILFGNKASRQQNAQRKLGAGDTSENKLQENGSNNPVPVQVGVPT